MSELPIIDKRTLGVASARLHDGLCDIGSVAHDKSRRVVRIPVWRECREEPPRRRRRFLIWECVRWPFRKAYLTFREAIHFEIQGERSLKQPVVDRIEFLEDRLVVRLVFCEGITLALRVERLVGVLSDTHELLEGTAKVTTLRLRRRGHKTG